jgi:hypothetical protein
MFTGLIAEQTNINLQGCAVGPGKFKTIIGKISTECL